MATGRVPTTANSPLTAKGDLFGYSTTQARVAVGNNGETLVADSSTSTGLRYTNLFGANKNKIINGDFGIWQRGTSFTNPASSDFVADRFRFFGDSSGATRVLSQQTFTPGTAPVAGYEGQYFLRFNQSVAGTGASFNVVQQFIEDVRTFAGQTVTISFWAKAAASTTITTAYNRNYGTGGSSAEFNQGSASHSLTTSWARYTSTVSIDTLTGKTIGANSYLTLTFGMPINTTFTVDIWGVQMEAGSVATAFQTATGTIQGELAACQRYYYRAFPGGEYSRFSTNAPASNTTLIYTQMALPVTMRVPPTSIDYSTLAVYDGNAAPITVTSAAILTDSNHRNNLSFQVNVASGLTQYRSYITLANNSTSAYIGASAEL
jgi:hypothetical protein